ncbi:MAG: sugar ABC transporter permease [Firmicutes bacterium]|nr:sugar ABC transporter permease [Bacillota bacterium]
MMRRKTKRLIYYCAMSAIPVVQFLVFYAVVNANSLLLAFQKYDIYAGKYIFAGFDNFKAVWADFGTSYFKLAFKNSLLVYAIGLPVGTLFGLLFSYYVYKKARFSTAFKILLFLPSVISSLALIVVFLYFSEEFVPAILQKLLSLERRPMGLLDNPDTRLTALIVFNLWIGVGGGVLIYASAMSGISPSLTESAQLDGAGALREFWHITLPMIYPMWVTFTAAGLAGIFLNQLNVFGLYFVFADPEIQTIGYLLYTRTLSARLLDYPELATIGLMLTLVLAPTVLLVKKGLEKFGPRAE